MPVSARADRRARFAELHARRQLFVLPNPWDVGSARLLEAAGFEALATTSAGFAWALGKLDHQVTRDALVSHVDEIAGATSVPLNVDSERCYPDDAGGISETVRRLSIEDYDPATERIDDVDVAVAHLKEALEAARAFDPPLVVTARAENHIRGAKSAFPLTCSAYPTRRRAATSSASAFARSPPAACLRPRRSARSSPRPRRFASTAPGVTPGSDCRAMSPNQHLGHSPGR